MGRHPSGKCGVCGYPKIQDSSGKWRCTACNKRKCKEHYRAKAKPKRAPRETVPCQTCRKPFERSAASPSPTCFCARCRNTASKAGGNNYTPTPEQIKAATVEIRERWTEAELERRAGVSRPVEWMPPEADCFAAHRVSEVGAKVNSY